MNLSKYMILLLLIFPVTDSVAENTPSAAMLEIATIMHRLKHFPSPVGKTSLQSLSGKDSTTGNERILIQAMLNLQHHVDDADKAKLASLVQDKSATTHERSVASILLNLDHRPTKQDKFVLSNILGK